MYPITVKIVEPAKVNYRLSQEYGNGYNYWVIRFETSYDKDRTYMLKILYVHPEPSIRLFCMEMGDEKEIVSVTECRNRDKTAAMHDDELDYDRIHIMTDAEYKSFCNLYVAQALSLFNAVQHLFQLQIS